MAIRIIGTVLACLLLMQATGCSKSDTVPVSGVVTWNGQPLASGEVAFFPIDAKIRPSAGRIKDGQFDFLSKTGKMVVRIEAARDTGKRDERGNMIDELFIPAKYNRESKLDADVTPDGNNYFEFALSE